LGTSRTISRKDYSRLRVAEELGELLGNPSYAAKAAEIAIRFLLTENWQLSCCAYRIGVDWGYFGIGKWRCDGV
jgi:rhamnosyltransferase subunit B